jgi:hypothetical protein
MLDQNGLKNYLFNFCYLIRVEHEKCSVMCLWIIRFGPKLGKWDLVLEKMSISEKVPKKPYTLFSNPCQSVRERPKILKICQITKLDMGFQKINMRSRLEKVDFLPQAKFRRSLS